MANPLREELIARSIAKQWENVSYIDLDEAYTLLAPAEKNTVILSLMNADNGARNLMIEKFNAQFLINATAQADNRAAQIAELQATFQG